MGEERNSRRGEVGAGFLRWLDGWYEELASVSLRDTVLPQAGGAAGVAVVAVDLLLGFCSRGPLASPRVGRLAGPAALFMEEAWTAGIRRMVLAGDSHPPDSPEFAAFPPHCVTGTDEAEPIPELTALPFFSEIARVPKGSLNVGLEEGWQAWEARFPDVRGWIVLGDCTDLCIYQTALHLRLQANRRGAETVVWVPANLVDTYDLPVEIAPGLGALPHDADLMHRLFLYHMALNGIRVVREITP